MNPDFELEKVRAAIERMDPDGQRMARVLRGTIDQLYDGQRTGRYRWDQLYKTEKTHCGTLVEINLQREFDFGNGIKMDYQIEGIEVDCKFSQDLFKWMIPPEAHNHICLLVSARDDNSRWSAGLLRITDGFLSKGSNRDQKYSLNPEGRNNIQWLHRDAPLPRNVLLELDQERLKEVMTWKSGQKRLNELFRMAVGLPVGRAAVATVAKQLDYMKRIRDNGGARRALLAEGYIVLGQYLEHGQIAEQLGFSKPGKGESLCIRVVPADRPGPGVARIAGGYWRKAGPSDKIVPAPVLPLPKKKETKTVLSEGGLS